MKLKAKVNGISSTIELDLHQIIKYAKVTGVNGNLVNLKFDGEQETSSLSYVSTCTCSVNDKVVCLHDGFNIVVIGVTNHE
nr:MAG TPA: hypothetical protein [Caudoviricetes sp.]